MEYIIIFIAFLLFTIKIFSFRKKSIKCAIDALKKTVAVLPDESTPSPRAMKFKLAIKYDELSHRSQSNDIREYAKKTISIENPRPEHIAMLMLISISYDLKQEYMSLNQQALSDISNWCDAAYKYLLDKSGTGTFDLKY